MQRHNIMTYTQGTVLGPILILVHINENIKHSKIQLFVDDIAEISTMNDAQWLQEDLDLLQGTWLLTSK